MAAQTLLWTALPNGADASFLHLSVLVSPRLDPAGSPEVLGTFTDFVSWPPPGLVLVVTFTPDAGPAVTRTVTPVTDATLWPTLFSTKTTVRGFTFNETLLKLPVQSYPVASVLAFLKGQYIAVASNPGTVVQLPTVQQLADPAAFGQLAVNWRVEGQAPHVRAASQPGSRDASFRDRLAGELAGRARCAPPPGHAPDPPYDVFLARDFNASHTPTEMVTDEHGATFAQHKPTSAAGVAPTPDFHQALAALADHPALLRRLGMLLDLDIAVAGLPANGFVSVAPAATVSWGVTTSTVSPRTAYGPGFRAVPRPGSEIVDGLLELADTARYSVVEVDVDGAAFKATAFADSLARALSSKKSQDTPDHAGLPPLREAGLAIVRNGKASAQVQKFGAQLALQAGATSGTVTVFADDLARGHRVDVTSDDGATWHSLCERDGTATFDGAAHPSSPVELHDEGWVSPSATSTPGEDPTTKLFVGEPLARWNGWSLVAPRPGQHIGSDDLPADPPDNPAKTEFSVSLTFAAKNLPRLRFGRTYRLRVRVADLAGNGVAAPAGTAHASPPLEYRRFDPVSAPALVLHEVPEEGEAVARLVIRTFNDDESKDAVVSPDVTERHLAPPQASQLLAEAHGRFDGMSPPDAYLLAAEREGTYEDLANPMTGVPYAPAGPTGIELVVVAPAPPADPAQPALPPAEPYTVVVHHEDSAPLPYLADPLARGVALLGMPWADHDRFLGLPSAPLDKQTEFHGDGTVTVTQLFDKPEITLVMVDFGPDKDWPDLVPFRLRAVEGSAPPAFDAASRVLTVGLPKAMVARTRASSYVDVAALKVLGIWGWVAENAAAPHADLERLTLQGRHHMMTPWRDLVLVHAVQQPIGHPVLAPGLVAVRHLGETFATVTGSLAVHLRSTGRFDVEARWPDDLVDDVTDPDTDPAQPVPGAGHAFGQTVEYPVPDPKQVPIDTQALAHRHDFGDTRHRMVRYKAVGSSRFREYFPAGTPATRESPEVIVDVPSSARPAAPHVAYVVPTFGWQHSASGASPSTSVRSGGGLRVYLERPWHSSGADELLGLLLHEDPLSIVGGAASPDQYVTRWGGDPVSGSPVPHRWVTTADLPLATVSATHLGLAELPDVSPRRVTVAGHPVHYDHDRRLWFSDLVVEPGPAYLPFVRMALVRFQPHSISGAELSRVVVADFAQLTPDRSASLTVLSPTQVRVSLVGVGITTNAVQIEGQHRLAGGTDELSWAPLAVTVDEVPARVGRAWNVTLPADAGGRRVVLRELEQYASLVGQRPGPARLVYAEAFELV